MEKLFQLLLSPISKLERVSEENSNKITSIEMMTVDIKSLQGEAVKELKEQTVILSDIREFIKERSKAGAAGERDTEMAKAAGFKPLTMKETGLAAFMVVGISAAIVASAALFSFIPAVSPMQLLTAALIAVAFVAIAPAFVKIANVLSSMKGETSFEGKGLKGSKVDSSGIMPLVAGSLIALLGMSAAIVMSSLIFQLIMPVSPAKLITALLISLALLPMSIAFTKILESLSKIKDNLSATGKVILTIIGISMAIVASSLILQLVMPISPIKILTAFLIGAALIGISYAFSLILKNLPERMNAKDVLLITSALVLISLAIVASSVIMLGTAIPTPAQFLSFFLIGIALIPASFALSLILKNIRRMGMKQIILAASSIVLIAGAIVATAHILQLYPGDPKNLPGVKFSLLVGLALFVFSFGFMKIAKNMRRVSFKDMAKAAVTVAFVALAIVGVALALSLYPGDPSNLPSPKFAILSGLALFVFSFGFMKIAKNMRRVSFKDMAKAAATVAFIALAIVGVALALSLYPGDPSNLPSPKFAILSGLALFAFSFSFMILAKSMRRVSFKDIAKAAVTIAFVAIAIVGVAYAFSLYPGDPSNLPSPKFAILSGLALFAFSFSFMVLAKLMGRVSFTDIAKAAVTIAFVAIAIVGTAWIFSYLNDLSAFVAPPYDWSLKSGLALLIFGASYALISILTKTLGISTMLQGIIGVAVIALAILAVGWIFNMLAGIGWNSPPIEWSVGVALSLVAFTIPAIAIGLIATSGIGAVGLLLGVVGMIVIAAGIWVVAWIFSKLPDLTSVSKMLTEALLTPVNGIVDILKRLKEEVGVENLLPLAGGIIAISGSLLVLAAASAGAAAAGLGASLMNAGKAFVDFVSGSDTKGPLEILSDIINMAPQITKVAAPIKVLGDAFMFLQGGQNMEVLVRFFEIMQKNPNMSNVKAVQAISEPMIKMINTLKNLDQNAPKRLQDLLMMSKGLQVMSAIPAEMLSQISNVFNSMSKDLTSQSQAMPIIAGSITTISTSMSNMRSEDFVRIFEVMASSAGAIAVMSRPIESIATSMDKMSRISIEGIEWTHKLVKDLAKSSFNSQATALDKIAKSYASISKSSGSMNVEAINATSDMFKALAYLYQNGKKNAIEELGDKLVKAVKELASMIANFEDTVKQEGEGTRNVSDSFTRAANNLANSMTASGSPRGAAPANSSSNAELITTMQELVDLLQTGQAKITINDLSPKAEAKLA
jgi:hypothetical protein